MRTPARTLQSRIVWTTVLVTAVAVSAMIGTVLLVLQGLTTKSIDRRLSDQAIAVATTVVARDGTVSAPETPDDSIDDTTWIYDAAGRLVDGPRTGSAVTQVVESLADVDRRTRVERMERVFLAEPVRIDGATRAVVVVEASIEPYETTRDLVLVGLLGLGLVVTAGSAAVATWTVRRTLAPVESMASRAEDWSEHDLDARFDATGTDDEFAHLGRTLNVLLDRVAGALRSEQRLTAELAHELRTPLTAIRGEAELARMAGLPGDTDERLDRVMTLVDRMSSTIASLLAVARGDQRPDARTTPVELLHLAADQAPVRAGVTLTIDPGSSRGVEMSAPLVLAARALSPLVENAVRHARSAVVLRVTATERTVDVTVVDDGNGVDGDSPESLFTSGTRGAGSDGAGLGLALARRVARTIGGDVSLTSSSGPTSFTLTLPRH